MNIDELREALDCAEDGYEHLKYKNKQLQSEYNILKKIHVKTVNDFVDYRLKSMKMDHKLKDDINELKKRILENNGKVRNETIREILDYILEADDGTLFMARGNYLKYRRDSNYD